MPSGFELHVDISEALELAEDMKKYLSPEKAQKVLHHTIVDTGKRSKTIMKNVASHEFCVTKQWAAKQIFNMRMTGPMSAEIPLSGHRGVIGKTFKMDTVRISRKKGASKRRRVKAAHIKRSGRSMLPDVTPHQGGNIIFPVGKIAATRSEKKKLVRVVGKSLPQMIVNSPASETVDKDIGNYMKQRLEHHIKQSMTNWK